MNKKIKLPEGFTDFHYSTDYLRKLIGKNLYDCRLGRSQKIIGLKEVKYNNTLSYESIHIIDKLGYELENKAVYKMDYLVAVMLIEGGYAKDAIGYEYEIID